MQKTVVSWYRRMLKKRRVTQTERGEGTSKPIQTRTDRLRASAGRFLYPKRIAKQGWLYILTSTFQTAARSPTSKGLRIIWARRGIRCGVYRSTKPTAFSCNAHLTASPRSKSSSPLAESSLRRCFRLISKTTTATATVPKSMMRARGRRWCLWAKRRTGQSE